MRRFIDALGSSDFHFQTTSSGSVSMTLTCASGGVTINWGDGATSSVSGTGTYNHTYSGAGTKSILFTGTLANITGIVFSSASCIDMNVDNLSGLLTLTSASNNYTSLSITNNNITTLSLINNSSITQVIGSLTGCTNVNMLNCSAMTKFGGAGVAANTVNLDILSSSAQYYQFRNCSGIQKIAMSGTKASVIEFDFRGCNITYTTASPLSLTNITSNANVRISSSTSLQGVLATGTSFAQVDFSGNTSMTMYDKGGGSTTHGEFTSNTSLTLLNIAACRFTTVDVAGSTSLADFTTNNNTNVTTISLGTISTLNTFYYFSCPNLSKIDTGSTPANTVDLTNNPLLTIWNGSSCPNIQKILWPSLSNTCAVTLTSCGLTHNSVDPMDISLVTGDLSLYLTGNTLLEEIYGGSMTSLKVLSINDGSTAHAFKKFDTGATGGNYLDLVNQADLVTVEARKCAFTQLDVSASVIGVNCKVDSNNSLTYINVGTTALWQNFWAYNCSSLSKIDDGSTASNTADLALFTSIRQLYVFGTALSANINLGAMNSAQDIQLNDNVLASGSVDSIIAVFWTNRNNFTYATPFLNMGGTNAAAGGTYQAQCPPTTGKEKIYELVNDSCAEGFNNWSITYTP